MPIRLRRLSLTTALVGLFLPLVCGTGLLVSALGVRRTEEVLSSASTQTLQAMVGELRARIGNALDPGKALLELERINDLADDRSFEQRLAVLPTFAEALANTPTFASYLVADRNGSLFMVARAQGLKGPVHPDLPPGAALVVQGLEPGARRARTLVFDAALRQLSSTDLPVPEGFVLKDRPWVRLAQGARTPVLAPVHRFAFGGGLGVTLSMPTGDGGAVGAALPLAGLGQLLERYRITPSTELAIVTQEGSVIATPAMQGMGLPGPVAGTDVVMPTLSQLGLPALAALAPRLQAELGQADEIARPPGFSRFQAGGEPWRGAIVSLPSPLRGGSTFLLVALPERELLADARRLARDGGLATLLVLLFTVPVVLLLARRLSASLRRLARQAQAIRAFQLDGEPGPRSRLAEVDELAITFDGMRSTIRRFLDISALLAAEENVDRLLEKLLAESVQVSGAQGGSLVVPPDRRLELGSVSARAWPCPCSAAATNPSASWCCTLLPLPNRPGWPSAKPSRAVRRWRWKPGP